MTLSLIPPDARLRRFVCTGGETVLAVTFPFFDDADLQVVRLRAGAETTLALTADYTVAGAGSEAGGSITLLAAAQAGDVIAIRSAQPIARTEDFTDGQALTAAALNAEFARWWIALQQLAGALDRVIRLADTDAAADLQLPPVAARANKILGFDAAGALVAIDLDDVLGDGGDYVLLQTEDGVSLAVSQSLLDALLAAVTGSIGAFSAYATGTVLPLASRAAWQGELGIVPNAVTAAGALAHVLAQGGAFTAKVTLDPADQTAANDAATRGYVDAQVAAASFGTTPYLHVQHERAAGANGGGAVSGAWTVVPLNTTKATAAAISSATHDTGAFTLSLPAGTYRVRGWQAFCEIDGVAQVRLRDTTNNVTLALGGMNRMQGDRGQWASHIDGTFTLAGTATVRLEYRVAASRADYGLGRGVGSAGWGEANVFGSLIVEKVA